MEQTQRLQHRIDLLLLSPNWREMPWAERVLLRERLQAAPAYATLDDEARSNLPWSAWQCAKDEAGLEIDFSATGICSNPPAMAMPPKTFVERALDTVGRHPDSWSDEMADEEARFLVRSKAPNRSDRDAFVASSQETS